LAKEQYREESNTGANNGHSTKDNARSQVKTGFDGTNNPRYIDSDGLTHDTPDTQYLKTSLGEVLGFVYKGEIYLDETKFSPEAPLHEYTHIWD
jgi:hypothetical protein